ncbi:hypothetical protein G4B88_028464 [Cannabis sativa]|uniref:Uncharacterized protein n=1 Tax=Cannabis sativa TaxID=3483 RepID=A0A7J6E4C8_CANSA|nr:hypothetical protein G4B88_028464 [Cannabis sativa]
MEAPKTIAHEIGGLQNDALRFGLNGVKSDIVGSHPIETACQSAIKRQEDINRKILANTYGSAFSLKMDLDRQILSRFQRPPGVIPSSMLGFEAITGALDDFCFEDYLNGVILHIRLQSLSIEAKQMIDDTNNEWEFVSLYPRESETFRPVDMHHGMEVRLGLSKGPVCPSFM